MSDNPDRDTLVYLRTALDPAPVVTRAGEFLGLVEAARLWLRRNAVGPGDVVAILAPNVAAPEAERELWNASGRPPCGGSLVR